MILEERHQRLLVWRPGSDEAIFAERHRRHTAKQGRQRGVLVGGDPFHPIRHTVVIECGPELGFRIWRLDLTRRMRRRIEDDEERLVEQNDEHANASAMKNY